MAEWNRNKVLPSAINGGREFTTDDDLAIEELNAMVNNSFYGVDFAEAMADTPIVDNSNPSAEPTVELVDNVKNGKTYKKFKFSNLKGARGEQGASGEDGESAGFGTPTASIESLDVNAQPTVSVSASGNNTAKVFDFKFGIPKPSTTTDSVLDNTSTNPVQNKVIANILSPSSVYNPLVIGKGASADTSQGLEYSTAIGNNASTYKNGTSLGYNARTDAYGTSVGASSSASNYGVSIGAGAHTTAQKSIQLGEGINSTANTLQVGDKNIYNHSTDTLTVGNAQVGGSDVLTKANFTLDGTTLTITI